MQLVSYTKAASKKTVTGDPSSAGLIPYTVDDLRSGRASGLVCGGGPSSTTWCSPLGKHGVVAGYTSAGKTYSCFTPTIVINGTRRYGHQYPKNMVIYDSKRTLWRETAPYVRSQGYEVKAIDLMSTDSEGRWNILSEAYSIIKETRDIAAAEQSISRIKASAIASVHSEKDAYWEHTAWAIVLGVAISLCILWDHEPSLADVSDAISEEDTLLEIRAQLGSETPKGVLTCIDLFNAKTTWSCVKSVVDAMLGFYVTDMGRRVASSSNVNFRKDFFGSKPVCYYVISPDNNPLCSTYAVHFLETAVATYMDEFEMRNLEGTDKHGLILMIDEFARLPRCEQILSVMATGRSRNITLYIAIQSFSQFLERGLYTGAEARVILEQSALNVFMANISQELAQDAAFKSGGVVGADQMQQMAPGDAFVHMAGCPMVNTHMEPLDAYKRYLDIDNAKELIPARVGRDAIIERILDLRAEDERAGNEWEIGGDELLNALLDVFYRDDGSSLSLSREGKLGYSVRDLVEGGGRESCHDEAIDEWAIIESLDMLIDSSDQDSE